jgi:integrase
VNGSVFRRCGCRDENGKQLGAKCPKLKTDPKHGSWSYYLSAGTDPRTKRRRQYSQGKFATKREASAALALLKSQVDTGTYVEPSKLTLAEYAPQVLQRRLTTGSGLKPSTAASYDRYVRGDIVPSRLGDMQLTDIRRSHVNGWISDLSKAGRGAVTVRLALATLRMIFSAAVRDEIIPANPALNVDKPTVSNNGEHHWEPRYLSEFLDRAARHRLGPLFELAVLTGLRRGEITGLHWSDVDLVKRTVTVRRNRVVVEGRITETTTTKTKAGLRTVSLGDAAVAALLAWQLRQSEDRENAQEAWQSDGHVFTMEDGQPLNPAYVTKLFQKLRAQGEPLPELTFHGLRHSYTSLLIAAGTDIAVVSKLLGHSSIAITADVYGHLVGTVASDAANSAAALIPRTSLAQPGVSA